MLKTPEKIQYFQRKTIPEGQAGDCESLWKKIIGRPYSVKLNVRFDEGELEVERG